MICYKSILVVCCIIVVGQTHEEDEQPNNEIFDHKGTFSMDPQNHSSMEETYVHWGKSRCNEDKSDTVYSGFIGGGHYSQIGAGTNALCLTDSPEYDDRLVVSGGIRSHVYGAEYQTHGYSPLHDLHDHDAVCAVCLTRGRSTTLMIPGKRTCPKGWTKEYGGLLMGGFHFHPANHEYLCMDGNPQGRTGDSRNHDGILFFATRGICGSLPCPPYVNSQALLCVVCSK